MVPQSVWVVPTGVPAGPGPTVPPPGTGVRAGASLVAADAGAVASVSAEAVADAPVAATVDGLTDTGDVPQPATSSAPTSATAARRTGLAWRRVAERIDDILAGTSGDPRRPSDEGLLVSVTGLPRAR
jgi:hypothetical protein